ncbi:unnamed protein product [Vitrella brassicaformis CCMP3155]|uniref:Uncharacterized protein n=1 Tax=Vitrella brassicaformis (strain CCMP3155) TaxID=1169540 RepID=A0A0G4GJA3_VITBC|nr:unnamed protein product [Vitrella brassicaformis CCMP3155]|eukprot:CEM29838.1 unnamed protein product [Vitrella brassicaformis CCMP3155]
MKGVGRGWVKVRVEVPDESGGMEFVMHDGRGSWDNPPTWYGHLNYQVFVTSRPPPALLIVTLMNGTINVERAISAADVPQHLAITIAEYVKSYSQLEALIDAHPTQFTAAVLLPILTRLLPFMVATIFGGLVQVPLYQLTQGGATSAVVEQLTRLLFTLEYGGDWARCRPHLQLLYHLCGKVPLVLRHDYLSVFGSRTAFVGRSEAVRQWKILSRGLTFHSGGQQIRLMSGIKILDSWHYEYRLPSCIASPSPLFPDTFDPADRPTQMDSWTYCTYSSMVAFVLVDWLRRGRQNQNLRRIRWLWCFCPSSAAYRRVNELLMASHNNNGVAQWGPGVTIFDKKREGARHERLVVLGSEAIDEGKMAAIWLARERGDGDDDARKIVIFTTESAPHDRTRVAVMGVLGDDLGDTVWWERVER